MKKYMDIKVMQPKFTEGFNVGDHIIIQEKIDGANFSIRYDEKKDEIISFSRKEELNALNNLRGAWEFSQKLDKKLVKNVLGSKYVLFGEWLVKHSVPYPTEKYNNAYFYDVYDVETEIYLDQSETKEFVNKLGLNYVPVFYDGNFISWDHIRSFIGRTDFGGEYGEGVVVKNMTTLSDPDNRLPFYVKLVGEKFAEKKSVKVVDPAKITERERLQQLTETIVTEARVTKLLHKMVDEGIVPEDWDETNMKDIARNIGSLVYYDCQKEEPETVEAVGAQFGKFAAGAAMRITRKILANRQSFI